MQRRSVRRIEQADAKQQGRNDEFNNLNQTETNSESNGSLVNDDVINLLKNISAKLDKISLPEETSNPSLAANPQQNSTNGNLQSQQFSTELRDLFAKILTQQEASNQIQQGTQQSVSNPTQQVVQQSIPNKLTESPQQNTLNQVQPGAQQNSSVKNDAKAVQTAAQVLSEAQFELSNELEASLAKLQKVIRESEKVANNISRLLGKQPTNT